MTTRRALLGAGAGAVALLAGCGREQEPKIDAGAVLSEQQRLTERAVGSYEGIPLAGALKANAEARVRRLNAVLERFPGKSGETLEKQPETGLDAALAAESAALRAHVAAVGQLQAGEYRELLAGLVIGAAANQAALLLRLDRPPAPTAFPGEPV
jgi:hypothetical protein